MLPGACDFVQQLQLGTGILHQFFRGCECFREDADGSGAIKRLLCFDQIQRSGNPDPDRTETVPSATRDAVRDGDVLLT